MNWDQDNAVGIVTYYELDGPGVEIFCIHLDQPWGPPILLYNGNWLSFPRVKWVGCGVDHPLCLAPRLKKE